MDYITKNNFTVLDSNLYFYLDNGKLICFDGNHRLESIILLKQKNQINIKIPCYIIETNLESVVIERFNIINSNSPIPIIYSDILNNINSENQCKKLNEKKDIIIELFDEYKTSRKNFYSIKQARKPNFNETMFFDLCNSIEFNTKIELNNKLLELNESKKTIINKLSENQRNKCNAYDFYLFI